VQEKCHESFGEKSVLLSQLVDGELPTDQANLVLAEVF